MNSQIYLEAINAKLDQESFRKTFEDYRFIVEENLIENGGTLKHRDLIDIDFAWSYLVVVMAQGERVGFSLIRFSSINQHDITDGGYYYLSQIAVSKKYQHKGFGSLLLEKSLEICHEFPFVSSVMKTNDASLKLFSRYMTPINENENYIRFVDNNYYRNLVNPKKQDGSMKF